MLLEIHFCTLSRVYQEQRTEFGYILYVLKAVFLLVISPGELCAFLPHGREVCPRWNPGIHWGDVDYSDCCMEQNVCWAEFMWRDWEWPSFVTPEQVLILPCSLGKREHPWPSCDCIWGCLKWGIWHLWFLSTCVLQGGMVLWDTVCHYLYSTLCCSREQLFMFPSGNCLVRNSGIQVCCFGMSMATSCLCFKDIDAFTRYHNVDHYVRFLQHWVPLWIA